MELSDPHLSNLDIRSFARVTKKRLLVQMSLISTCSTKDFICGLGEGQVRCEGKDIGGAPKSEDTLFECIWEDANSCVAIC